MFKKNYVYNYVYKVRFKKKTLFSKAHYSFALYRDTPIVSEKDKRKVKKLVKLSHPFSKCEVLSAELLEILNKDLKTERPPRFIEF